MLTRKYKCTHILEKIDRDTKTLIISPLKHTVNYFYCYVCQKDVSETKENILYRVVNRVLDIYLCEQCLKDLNIWNINHCIDNLFYRKNYV